MSSIYSFAICVLSCISIWSVGKSDSICFNKRSASDYQDTIKLLKGYCIYQKQKNDSCILAAGGKVNNIYKVDDELWDVEVIAGKKRFIYKKLTKVFVKSMHVTKKGELLGLLQKDEEDGSYLLELIVSNSKGEIAYKF